MRYPATPIPTSAQIKADIEAQMGFFPPFFEPALANPLVLSNLWQQTLTAYLQNPLPTVFKETLLAYLARYCSVPYSLVCHCCTLYELGLTANQIFSLITTPMGALLAAPLDEAFVQVMSAAPSPSDSAASQSLLNWAIAAFLQPQSPTYRQLLQHHLGAANYGYLVAFLGYVRVCHEWAESYPDLNYGGDRRAQQHLADLLQAKPELADFFAHYRAQIRQEQTQHENMLHLILQTMPVMLDAFDGQGNVIVWNHECERVTGYQAHEIVGNPQAMQWLYPDTAYREQMVANWNTQGCNYRNSARDITCKDGTVKTIAWSNISDQVPIRGWAMWGIGVDITEHKCTERLLRQSEERFRGLVQNASDIIVVLDADGYYTYISPSIQPILGYQPEQLLGSDAFALIHPDDLPLTQSAFHYVLQEPESSVRVEFRFQHRDGAWVFMDCVATNLLDQPSIQGVVVNIRDCRDRKQAESAIQSLNASLEQQNLELEALVEQRTAELLTFINTLPDFIFVVDRGSMRMRFCNDMIARLVGLESRQQVEGKTLFECYEPELATTFAAQNEQVFSSGETLHFQECYTTPLGTFNFDTYKIPLKRPNGDVYALIGTSRDVTELVMARQALTERTLQLEAMNRELESFSYSVSHDLRAPLRHISGFVAALTDRLEQAGVLGDAKTAHYLQVIRDSSRTMGQLIEGLLTLSRLGRRQMANVPVDLNQLVATAIARIRATADHDATPTSADDIVFHVEPLPTVMGDATLLLQVFQNLLDNAIKFSRGRQPIQIEIGALPDGTIVVRDYGVGFSMEHADQLFGAFQRLHTASEFEGTGIGLAIVQRIVHRHNGSIWAESQPEQGASFFFKLGP